MTLADGGEQVHLVVPADPAYARVARIAAAHLALRKGFSLPEIDDLRMVIDEATAMLIGDGSGGNIDINYEIEANTLAITAQLVGESSEPELALSEDAVRNFSNKVGELVDGYVVQPTNLSVALTKTKAQA